MTNNKTLSNEQKMNLQLKGAELKTKSQHLQVPNSNVSQPELFSMQLRARLLHPLPLRLQLNIKYQVLPTLVLTLCFITVCFLINCWKSIDYFKTGIYLYQFRTVLRMLFFLLDAYYNTKIKHFLLSI